MDEYNKYKNKMENALNEKIKNEEILNEEIIKKEKEILDIKNNIKNLEFENEKLKKVENIRVSNEFMDFFHKLVSPDKIVKIDDLLI